MSDNSVTNKPCYFRSYDGVPAEAAKLTIDYTPPNKRYRSVGNTSTALASGTSNALTISGSTATFASPLSENAIGVGDAIQYDSDDDGTIDAIAFIHGRTSQSAYTVKDKDGNPPTATQAADTDWAIYRCFLELDDWQDHILSTVNPSIHDNVDQDVLVNTDLTEATGADTIMMVACYAGASVDNDEVVINNWTTGPGNYIKIFTPVSSSEVGVSQRHDGIWDDSKYRIETGVAPINIGAGGAGASNVWIDGLQIYLSSVTGDGNSGIISYQTTQANHRISNNIVRGVTHATFTYVGIYFYTSAAGAEARIWNNIVYGFDGPNARGIQKLSANVTAHVYNNTVYGCWTGYIGSGGPLIAKNNIAYNNATNYAGTFDVVASTNNLSGPSPKAGSPGSNPKDAATVTFVNPTGSPPDFHLSASDTGAKNYGTDLSGDSSLAFTDDIDGNIRTGTWDIGADEVVAMKLYRSVGTTATDLNTSSRTVEISDTTATSSGSMPDNVGVGDVLVYNNGSNQIAFIHGRTSAKVFTVTNKDGGTPAAASAGTAVGVYRAYTSLSNWESQTENANITEPTEDDVNPSVNLTAATGDNTIMMVACYGDGEDTASVFIDSWTTGPDNYIKIYTPTSLSEVGTSQRHNGSLGYLGLSHINGRNLLRSNRNTGALRPYRWAANR